MFWETPHHVECLSSYRTGTAEQGNTPWKVSHISLSITGETWFHPHNLWANTQLILACSPSLACYYCLSLVLLSIVFYHAMRQKRNTRNLVSSTSGIFRNLADSEAV